MSLLWYYLAGFCAFNAAPHLIKGVTGQTHMTPFKRVSSPTLNIIWGFVNLFFGLYLLGLASGNGGLTLPWNASLTDINLWAFLAGAFSLGITAAWLFGRPNARLPWHRD